MYCLFLRTVCKEAGVVECLVGCVVEGVCEELWNDESAINTDMHIPQLLTYPFDMSHVCLMSNGYVRSCGMCMSVLMADSSFVCLFADVCLFAHVGYQLRCLD